MKTEWFFVTLLFTAILIASCQKEESGPGPLPVNGKLKQVLLYNGIDSETPIAIVEEYEYNEDGKIAKTSSPMYDNGTIVGTISYNLYEYNGFGQLARIRYYNANLNSPSGFLNLFNTVFTYFSDGMIATKTIEYQYGNAYEFYLYEYSHNQLARISKYDKGKLESLTVNEYDGAGRLTKESFYAADGQYLSYNLNTYSGNLLIRTDLYRSSTNTRYRTINRRYDTSGKLLVLESQELFAYSDMTSFVLKYKYFE